MIDSIYVTLGADQLKEKPYRNQIVDFLKCDGEKAMFYWKMSMKPTKEFVWVYIVIGSKVRWRARFVDWQTEGGVMLDDGRFLKGVRFARLIDFEKLPFPYEHKKGFQGFRYKK